MHLLNLSAQSPENNSSLEAPRAKKAGFSSPRVQEKTCPQKLASFFKNRSFSTGVRIIYIVRRSYTTKRTKLSRLHNIFICERLFVRMIQPCTNCKSEKEHHAKGLCYACYKKLHWKPVEGTCKRCKRKMALHAKGLCPGCYNTLFHQDNNKAYHHRKSNRIDLKTYKQVTKACAVCGFSKIVDIYHLDKNKENPSSKNLVGLCPNHHRMINNFKFRSEVQTLLQEKGFVPPLDDNFLPKKKTSPHT